MRATGLIMGTLLAGSVMAEGEIGITPEELPDGPVTITPDQQGNEIKEFRVNGRLYMVMVIPGKGAPYYLVDTDGDGNLETRRNNMDSDGLTVPTWVLKRW
jgi:hypothetical protein